METFSQDAFAVTSTSIHACSPEVNCTDGPFWFRTLTLET
jgi:hypothetical protein